MELIRKILIYLLPVWLVKSFYKLKPPTLCFRTDIGRTFRLIKVDDDFCLAFSSEVYDARMVEKLLEMQRQGEVMVDLAIKGINALSYERREDLLLKEARKNGNKLD